MFGVTIFLAFVLLASQTLLHLYASTLVGSTAFDAAKRAAAEDGGGCDVVASRVMSGLGRHADDAEVTCHDDGDHLAVRIVTSSPAQVFQPIERTSVVRVERPR
ncbi:MAG: hypothetical protein WD378_00730 [Egicoccus sp.]